ncbi:MAG: dihydropteroate synthase [Promethearchaeia archaeon]|nr:MAG: dihydropteroate synthase [Candidatus Lokiarchaeia archaeon]
MSEKKNPKRVEAIVFIMAFIQSKLADRIPVGDLTPVHLMGIINLSPESFFKESYISKEQILPQIKQDLANGATFLDFGARSTAPWSEPISLDEELTRVEQALMVALPHIPKETVLSIDTQYSEVAELAFKLAAPYDIPFLVNDISSFHTDNKMKNFVISHKVPVCLMATMKKPGDAKDITEILTSLSSTMDDLDNEKYPLDQVIVDPGIGKWVSEKTFEYDLEMLHNLEDLRALRSPILIGLSRKSFIGSVLGKKDPNERLNGSLAATSIAVFNGAHIIRAHQITSQLYEMVQMASALRKKIITTSTENQRTTLLPPFRNSTAAEVFLHRIGVSNGGTNIMKQKMSTNLIQIDKLTAPQALILKQEMLARGGDVALHKDVITTEYHKYTKQFTAIVMGTPLQLKKLVSKLKSQDLEMKRIGTMIEEVLTQNRTPKINFKPYEKEIKE